MTRPAENFAVRNDWTLRRVDMICFPAASTCSASTMAMYQASGATPSMIVRFSSALAAAFGSFPSGLYHRLREFVTVGGHTPHARQKDVESLGFLAPAGLSGLCGNLRALFRRQGRSSRRATLQPSQPSQSHRSRVLFGCGGRFRLRCFSDGFKKDAMGELIRIAWPCAGAVRHDTSSMTGTEPKSRWADFKLSHYQ